MDSAHSLEGLQFEHVVRWRFLIQVQMRVERPRSSSLLTRMSRMIVLNAKLRLMNILM